MTHDYLHVDNAAMQIVTNPRQFDVILTNNMFGDILSDEASVLAGSLGMLGSASLNADGLRHVRADPRLGAGHRRARGRRIPIAMILSVAMMLRLSFKLEAEAAADRIGRAPRARSRAADAGYRLAGGDVVSTQRLGEAIAGAVAGPLRASAGRVYQLPMSRLPRHRGRGGSLAVIAVNVSDPQLSS